jgi:hypothetical protein
VRPVDYARAIIDRLFPAETVPVPGLSLLEIADITYPYAVTELGFDEPLTSWAALLFATGGIEMPGPVPTFPVARRRAAKAPKPAAGAAVEDTSLAEEVAQAFRAAEATTTVEQKLVSVDDL